MTAPLLDETARGVFVIAPTPFTPDGAIDMASVETMTAGYLAAGAHGLTLLGIMGEAPKLTEAESLAVVRRVLEVTAGRVPVVVGVTAPGLAAMRALAQGAMAAGAAGVMFSPVAGLRGDAAVIAHVAQAAAAIGSDVPYVLQDYPQASGVVMTATMIARMAEDPRLVMLKAEDWPGLDKITALRALSDAGQMRRISILGGNGGLFLPVEIERGADGIMTGYAYPEMLVQVIDMLGAGEREAAYDLFDAHLPLIRTEHQPGLGLAVRKYILARRGLIASPALRPPAPLLSAETVAEVEWLIGRLERRTYQ